MSAKQAAAGSRGQRSMITARRLESDRIPSRARWRLRAVETMKSSPGLALAGGERPRGLHLLDSARCGVDRRRSTSIPPSTGLGRSTAPRPRASETPPGEPRPADAGELRSALHPPAAVEQPSSAARVRRPRPAGGRRSRAGTHSARWPPRDRASGTRVRRARGRSRGAWRRWRRSLSRPNSSSGWMISSGSSAARRGHSIALATTCRWPPISA